MQQSASQEGPGVLNEQAIMKAKRRSQTGSKMRGHNSACVWMISLPKLRKLGNMCRKAILSTARQFKACDHLRDKMHVSTAARLICCKAQLVQQRSNQPSKAGMLLCMYWQHAEIKAGLTCEGYLWRYDSDRNCQVLEPRQTSLLSARRGRIPYDPNELEKTC